MKKTDLAELKKMDINLLSGKAGQVRSEIQSLTLDKSMAKLANLKMIKNKRRDLAQILTILGQKQLLSKGERQND